MAKLESLVVGSEATNDASEKTETSVNDNEVATKAADTQAAVIQ